VNDGEHSYFMALRIGYCYVYMGVERGQSPPWILKFSTKTVVFLVSSGKNQTSPLLAPTWKKSFRRPCAFNVWNKTPEYIFQIA